MFCLSGVFYSGILVIFSLVATEVRRFQISDSNTLQCLAVREKERRQRWIAVEELDEDKLPEDFGHLLSLYIAWLEGNY